MQPRYRSSGDGFRSGSRYRNSNRGGFARAQPKPYPPPQAQTPRKADVLMEAGRLAAEYLVSKGLLPPNSLPVKWPHGRFQEFKGKGRGPQMPDSRTSALSRLGNPGTGRRMYDDEFSQSGSRGRSRGGRRRDGPYGRGYNSEWERREDRRRGQWMDRGRGYPDDMEGGEDGRRGLWMDRGRGYPDAMEGGDDDNFAPGYSRAPRIGYDEMGSNVSRIGSDDRHSKSEATGESGTEVDARDVAEDTGSKASSTSTGKDPEFKVVDEAKVSNSEAGDEVKSDTSGDSKKNKNLQDEDMDGQPCADEGEPVNKNGDPLKLWAFAKVPTKPRSSAAQRSPEVDQGTRAEACTTVEVAAAGGSEIIEGEEPVKGSSCDSHTHQTSTADCQALNVSNALPDHPMEEPVESHHGSRECLPGFVTSRVPVDGSLEGGFAQHIDEMEADSPPPNVSQKNEYSLQVFGTKQPSPCMDKFSMDEKMVEAVDQDKHVGTDAALFPKIESEINTKLEEEKQLLTTSFDLNLTGTPEITEIPDDPMPDQTSGLILENEKEPPVDVGLSIGNDTNVIDDYGRLSVDDKVIQVINLEDDSPMDDNACELSKLKNETMYSSLDNFLSPTRQEDLDGIQDGYSLAFPEFLGTDISGCSAVPGDLNLHDAQGVSGDDDSIYVSLGEIPIGLMGVWDQPSQEYGKFF